MFDSRRHCALCLFVLFGAFPPAAYAAAIGMPTPTARLGWGVGWTRLDVEDPDGPTSTTTAWQPVNLIYTDRLGLDLRYWVELYYRDAGFDAGGADIGQSLQGYGARASLQKQWAKWAPWLGVGLGLARDEFTKRYAVAPDGYLDRVFPGRSETSVDVLVNIAREWPVYARWDLGAKAEGAFPLGDGIQTWTLGVTALYRY